MKFGIFWEKCSFTDGCYYVLVLRHVALHDKVLKAKGKEKESTALFLRNLYM